MRVLLFAHLKDAAGAAELNLEFQGPVSLDELWAALIATRPALAPFRAVVRIARNQEYATPNVRLDPDDEVALIPPVSGG